MPAQSIRRQSRGRIYYNNYSEEESPLALTDGANSDPGARIHPASRRAPLPMKTLLLLMIPLTLGLTGCYDDGYYGRSHYSYSRPAYHGHSYRRVYHDYDRPSYYRTSYRTPYSSRSYGRGYSSRGYDRGYYGRSSYSRGYGRSYHSSPGLRVSF